jgi:hypothetical protein
VPSEADPNDVCSDLPFEIPFFENGPQCIPFILPRPKASAVLTFIVDDQVTDYRNPDLPTHAAFTVLIEVKARDGRHLLSETYQDLTDATVTPVGLWETEFGFETVEESGSVAFFGDPDTVGIPGLLRDFKPLLYLGPEAQLGNALRELLGAPENAVPVILSSINDPARGKIEDKFGDPLATVVRVRVKIGFISPTLDGAPPCPAQP